MTEWSHLDESTWTIVDRWLQQWAVEGLSYDEGIAYAEEMIEALKRGKHAEEESSEGDEW